MILIKPHITEKSTKAAANQVYTFKVNPEATKGSIKSAVEQTFKVTVLSVRTVSRPNGLKRIARTGKYAKVRGGKIAYVTLGPKDSISYFSTDK